MVYVCARLHTCWRMCVAEKQNMWQCDVGMCAPCVPYISLNECVWMSVWASLPASQHACAWPLRHVGKHELPELNPCPLNSYWSRSRGRKIKFHLVGFIWARMLACSPPFRLSTPYKEERKKWGKGIGWSLGDLLEEMDEKGKRKEKEQWSNNWLLNYTRCWTWDWTCLHVSVLESVCKSGKVNVINIIMNGQWQKGFPMTLYMESKSSRFPFVHFLLFM